MKLFLCDDTHPNFKGYHPMEHLVLHSCLHSNCDYSIRIIISNDMLLISDCISTTSFHYPNNLFVGSFHTEIINHYLRLPPSLRCPRTEGFLFCLVIPNPFKSKMISFLLVKESATHCLAGSVYSSSSHLDGI